MALDLGVEEKALRIIEAVFDEELVSFIAEFVVGIGVLDVVMVVVCGVGMGVFLNFLVALNVGILGVLITQEDVDFVSMLASRTESPGDFFSLSGVLANVFDGVNGVDLKRLAML